MPRVSCGRAGSTRKARQKRNTRRRDPRDPAGYGDRWFRPFAPFFCAPGAAQTYIYDGCLVSQIERQSMCGGMQPLLPNFAKKVCHLSQDWQIWGIQGSWFRAVFAKGPCRALLRGTFCHQNFPQKSRNLCQKQHAGRKFVWYVKKRIS